MTGLLELAERGWLPDAVIRVGVRRLLLQRLGAERRSSFAEQQDRLNALAEQLAAGPLAVHPEKTDLACDELPPAFVQLMLGHRLRRGCCLFELPDGDLDAAETAMLDLVGRRAALANGQDVLDLGCGWGDLTLWMAERFPDARITAVCTSAARRPFIEWQLAVRGVRNVRLVAAEVDDFAPTERFDRVLMAGAFERIRNHRELMRRVAEWLVPEGRLFVEALTHRDWACQFGAEDDDSWVGRHLLEGGMVIPDHLLLRYQDNLRLEQHWLVDGMHYCRTVEAWLANLDARRDQALDVLVQVYGKDQAHLWLQRWRVVLLARAELWGYDNGREWRSCHYRFGRR